MTTELVSTQTGEIIEVPNFFANGDIIKKATDIANQLAPIVESKELFKVIGKKKHVFVDGWATMGAMLGVFPRTSYARRLEREDEIIYESRVELYTIKGDLVGAGEAVCSSREANWRSRDEYTIKSMAQTRATGKAFRLSFSWIMALAGYSSTPAEEMIEERPPVQMPKPVIKPVSTPTKKPGVISVAQQKLLFTKCKSVGIETEDFKEYLKRTFGIEHSNELPWNKMDEVLKWIDSVDDAPEIQFGSQE